MKKFILFIGFSVALVAKTQIIIFGAGCFWGVEKHFESLHGVKRATSGYAGGSYVDPNYKTVLKYRNTSHDIINHAEVVKVIYDDQKISTESLIKSFWELHDPTQGNKQGNDIGNNYRSVLYYITNAQKQAALATKEAYQKLLSEAGYGTITTEIKPLKRFYVAEIYHQNYLEKNPLGYCPNHSTGIKFGSTKIAIDIDTITPLGGKEIIVIDSMHCKYCKKFKAEVTDHYKDSIPLRTTELDSIQGFKIHTHILGTPAILFFEDGEEVFSNIGYMDTEKFYKALHTFKNKK